MSVMLTVRGTIQYGRLKEFADSVGAFTAYRRQQGWAVPEVLYGLAGPMNTVLMVFRYDELSGWEREAEAERRDPRYGQLASKLPYTQGSIAYDLFQSEGGSPPVAAG